MPVSRPVGCAFSADSGTGERVAKAGRRRRRERSNSLFRARAFDSSIRLLVASCAGEDRAKSTGPLSVHCLSVSREWHGRKRKEPWVISPEMDKERAHLSRKAGRPYGSFRGGCWPPVDVIRPASEVNSCLVESISATLNYAGDIRCRFVFNVRFELLGTEKRKCRTGAAAAAGSTGGNRRGPLSFRHSRAISTRAVTITNGKDF